MPLLTFSSLLDAQKAQDEIDAPLLVFAHSANEATEEELAGNPRLPDLPAADNDYCLKSDDFPLGAMRGRGAQREALERVLMMGRLDRVVVVHEVQEGTTGYAQLVQAMPAFTALPRAHLLPSRRSCVTTPMVLCDASFTSSSLLEALTAMLRLPLGGAFDSSSSTPSSLPPPLEVAKKTIRDLIEEVDSLNATINDTRRSSSADIRPFTSPSISTRATAGEVVIGKKSSAAPASYKRSPPIAGTNTPVLPSVDPTKRANEGEAKKRSASCNAVGDSAPLPQRKKPEDISIRCTLPNGTFVTVTHLHPLSSSIGKDVRPVIRESLGHDQFDLVKVGTPPQRLDRDTHESVTLQEMGICTSSSLRVVTTQQPASAPPTNSVPASGPDTNRGHSFQLMQNLMGALRAKVQGGVVPPPSARVSAPVPPRRGNIRTLDDVLAARQDERPMMPFPPPGGHFLSPGERGAQQPLNEEDKKNNRFFTGDSTEMLGRDDEDEDEEPVRPPTGIIPFTGTGRRLRGTPDEEEKKKQ